MEKLHVILTMKGGGQEQVDSRELLRILLI